MKKIALFTALIMLLSVFASCGISRGDVPADPQPAAPSAEPTPVAPVDTDIEGRSRTQQYGFTEAIVRYGDNFNGVIYYPASDLEAADNALREWAAYYMDSMADVMEVFEDEVEDMSADIYVHYDSYLLGDRYVGIQEDGYYTSTIMIHPLELIYTLNLDLATGTVLSPSDILTDEGIDYVLSTAKSELMAKGIGEEEFSHMNETWMEYTVLTNEGLRVTIARGLHIADAHGSHPFTFSYDELSEYLKIDIASPDPEPTPEPEKEIPAVIGELICNADGVEIYANATAVSQVLGSLSKGSKVELIAKSVVDGWDAILYKGDVAYVASKYLGSEIELPKVTETGTCTGEGVNIRTSPSTSAEILGQAAYGEKINVTRKNITEGWHEILYKDCVAYITNAYVKFASDAPDPEPSKAPAEPAGSKEPEAPATPIVPPASGDIDPNKPMIALTFDDGPSKVTTHILDLLETYGAKATFFVVGNRVESNKSIISRAIANGNEIGCHTWDHKNLKKLSKGEVAAEISDTVSVIKKLTGYDVRALRPPYGNTNDTVSAVCKEQGLAIVNWNIDTLDWKTRNADSTYNAIMKDVKDGSIILCHDLYGATGEAMERVIPKLIEQGYQLVTVSELLHYKAGGAVPGKVYRHG